jgi:predicted esterase
MESEPLVRTLEARVHGRYLVHTPQTDGPWPAVFSFHGYAEDASIGMAALQRIPAVDWLLVAVQALHPFYAKGDRIVASWMTRQDRELAIADNVRYVSAVVEAVQREFQVKDSGIVFAGFSQGVAMAYRAAAHIRAAGVIALAGDVPPDVVALQQARSSVLPHVLIGRGTTDSWYTEEKMVADVASLKAVAASVETCTFPGGHEWTETFTAAAGNFLARLARAPWSGRA